MPGNLLWEVEFVQDLLTDAIQMLPDHVCDCFYTGGNCKVLMKA